MTTRRIEFVDIQNLKVSVNTILNTFYTHSLMLHAADSQPTTRMPKAVDRYIEDLSKFFDRTIEEHARVVFWYLVIACANEVYHMPHYAEKDGECARGFWKKVFAKDRRQNSDIYFQVKGGLEDYISFGDRRERKDFISILSSLVDFDIQRLLELLDSAFNDVKWKSSNIGGKVWGAIVKAILLYWRGETDTLVFLDTAFTLRHHGDVLFNKMGSFSNYTDEIKLRRQLDVQYSALDITDLVIRLEQLHPYWEPGLVYLLQRGETFGYWKDLANKCEGKPAIEKSEKEVSS